MEKRGHKLNRVFVVGVGMTKFVKPSDKSIGDYPEFSKIAAQRALRDAGVPYEKIEHAFIGYVYGDSTAGQRALYEVGMTGIPISNVNNNCSTGSTALYNAALLIQAGLYDCTMALGFDKMARGSLQFAFPDRTSPLAKFISKNDELRKDTGKPFAPQLFGNAGVEHMEKYGTTEEHFAKVAYKNHLHSVNNPYSQFRTKYSLDEIKQSPLIQTPLTKLQCCPTSNGAACTILASEDFVIEHGLEDQAIEILSIAMATDTKATFESDSNMKLVGQDLTKAAAQQVFEKTGLTPDDCDVCELHDCFSANELLSYENLGLCPEGKAGEYIDKDAFTYGGKIVVNPSGGLISKGHPLGATGLAQCSELCWQLRNMAEKRQVEDAKIALQHNLGLGGACIVALYKKYNSKPGKARDDQTSDPAILEEFESKEAAPKLIARI
mmetsp:Transcript_15558/g.17291  ORF Transcript_15558/g.17291 Transcript_15558/m.17291 type:complete len:437 (+) Transcript_15558:31-1341(+)|eukprot:CAMPEP_0205821410 /NCGR_PEP_ID=MMETSP0206-20130828/7470_1 /ASSEMBLY_ACC=CAM_ASM_000279 /TAXON_ID=36767 /ORGANISM="Euplotes focardii, Strain TN1" /LENGTH=436 /DNA_ID=CAMNT_0053116867 /DNA_START=6 /DNA_END=1316 /DNA_ORIENTATION=-